MVLGCLIGGFGLFLNCWLFYISNLCFLGVYMGGTPVLSGVCCFCVFGWCRVGLGLDQAGGLACWIFGFGFGFAYLVGLVGYVTTRFGLVVLCFGYCCFVGVCL